MEALEPAARFRIATRGVGFLAAVMLTGCVGTLDDGPAEARRAYDALRPGPAGLRALTPAQYEASVRDVLGLGPAGSDDAPIAPLGQWATSIAAARGGFSPTTVESYEAGARDAAHWMTSEASSRVARVGCTPVSAEGDACVAGFVARIGRRAYRRSLTAEEQARWTGLAQTIGVSLGDPWIGLEYALSGILQSPHFLYRVEVAERDPSASDPSQLRYTGLEMATRLAYLVWGTTPDEALLAAAERGELTTEEGLSRAIDRMLDDPRSEVGLEAFVADLLEVDALLTLERDATLHPGFETLREPMREQLVRTATTALAEDGFSAMFTTRTTYVNRTIAPVLGLDPARFGQELTRFELPASGPRAGVLTQPGFLALHAYPGKTSPALRGLFVRRRLLCRDIPPPPASVSTQLPASVGGRLVTSRELVAAHQTNATCAGCHRFMDPIGLGLEQFDEIGAHRLLQNALPIDPTGSLDGEEFNDAVGLGAAVADHPVLGRCMASRLYAFAAGSTVPPDHPSIVALAADGDDVRTMFHRTLESELFRLGWVSSGTEVAP